MEKSLEKSIIEKTSSGIEKFIEIGPFGDVALIVILGIGSALILTFFWLLSLIVLHARKVFKKQDLDLLKEMYGKKEGAEKFKNGKNGKHDVHFIDRIRNLEKDRDNLYSKVDKLTEYMFQMKESIARIDQHVEFLYKKKLDDR